jgi:hypothetical protein
MTGDEQLLHYALNSLLWRLALLSHLGLLIKSRAPVCSLS